MEGTSWEDRLYQLVGRRVRTRREALKITQEELAERIHLTRTSITNVEGGRQKVPLHQLLRIATALDTDLRDLIPERHEFQIPVLVSVIVDGEQHQVPREAATFIKRHIQGSETPTDAPASKRRATRSRPT